MNSWSSFRLVDTTAGFNILLFLSFFIFGFFGVPADMNRSSVILLVWAAMSAAISYFLLDAIDYFESFLPLPSKTNLFTLLLTLPWGPVISRIFVALLVGDSIVRYRSIILSVPVCAILLLLYQYLSGWIFIASKKKRRIWPILNEKDTAALKSELHSRKLTKYFEWVNGATKPIPDLIVISRSGVRDFAANTELLSAHLNAVPLVDIRALMSNLSGKVDVETMDLWLYLQTATAQTGIARVYFQLKSVIEPFLGVLLALLLAPLFIFVAILVKISSPGPVIFKQVRTGFHGREFSLFKFRTMKLAPPNAPASWANSDSERITKIGTFLRKSHLDELPQLFNIAVGQLSFVGPRPERPEFYSLLKGPIPLFYLRTMVRPGVTGWAQVIGGYAGSVEESKEKLEYDLYYMQQMSPRLDVMVIIKTLFLFLSFRDEKAK